MMTGHTPCLHDNASGGGASKARFRDSLRESQEKKGHHSSLDSFCDNCAALTYGSMRVSEATPDGQLYHKNWTSLVKAGKLGCKLCTFFTVAALHPKSKPGKAFYSDENGPIRLKIVETWKDKVICLHMFVPQDKHPAVYYLYLITGRSSNVCYVLL